jgi:imidazole glycerol-phosphate synthase subunit HisF
MVTRRLIVCLDVKGGRVVKGVKFEALRDVGDPVELAEKYEADGADEIVYLDISATIEERATLLELARRTAERVFVPLTIGGGVRSADDVGRALRAGADKVGINTAAVETPSLLSDCAQRFGSQCVVASIDAKRDGERWRVYTHGGRTPTALDAVEWARECVRRGAGELLVTSIDRDGGRVGYDIDLTSAIADRVAVPVIASGGAGSPTDVCAAITYGHADAALVAGIVHDGVTTVERIKREMVANDIRVRMI